MEKMCVCASKALIQIGLLIIIVLDFPSDCLAFAQEMPMSERVEEELFRPQSYAGETFDQLVALGPESVPELCKRLGTFQYPMEITRVLEHFADPRATAPLINYIEQGLDMNLYMCGPAISALKEINDPNAEAFLLRLAQDENENEFFRFEAIAALARSKSPDTRDYAWREILSTLHTGQFGNVEIDHNEIIFALCEVRLPEADESIANFLKSGVETQNKCAVMHLLARREGTGEREKVVDALVHLLQFGTDPGDKYEWLPVRAVALSTLVAHSGAIPNEELLVMAQDLEHDALRDEDLSYAEYIQKIMMQIPGSSDIDAQNSRVKDLVNNEENPIVILAQNENGATVEIVGPPKGNAQEELQTKKAEIETLKSERYGEANNELKISTIIVASLILILLFGCAFWIFRKHGKSR